MASARRRAAYMSGDIYNRREVEPNRYQCGCHWIRKPGAGDILIECPIHAAATMARIRKFLRSVNIRMST